jgi:hypothetical protein
MPMYRKADRDNLAAVKNVLVHLAKSSGCYDIDILAQLDKLRKDLDKLLQSHAALEKEMIHQLGVLSLHAGLTQIPMVLGKLDKLQADFDQWPSWRNSIEDKLVEIEARLSKPRQPKKKGRR